MQIENMVVDEARRGRGAGRALLDACFDFARERDCYKVQLQSDEARGGAHRFYARAGFSPSSVGFRRYFE
jgi:GNAT superfamily N-acetyltransferase